MDYGIVDKWMIIELHHGSEVLYKLFSTWYGGYMGSDEWRLNSGIVRVEYNDDIYTFYGESGSSYSGHKDSYGASGWSQGVANNLVEMAKSKGVNAKILDRDDAILIIESFLIK